METTGIRGRLRLLYLATGLAVAAGSLRLPDLQASIVYQLVGVSAVVAILAGVRLHRPARTGGRDRAGLIDALIIATGLGLLSWTFLMRPIAADASLGLGSRLISLAYPLAGMLLLAVLARLSTSPGARGASYRLLGLALVLQLGADIVYAVVTTYGGYNGGLLDLGWMASYLCWGAAALHPSVRLLSEVAPANGVRVDRRRLLVLAPAALIAPALLLYQGARGWRSTGGGSGPAR